MKYLLLLLFLVSCNCPRVQLTPAQRCEEHKERLIKAYIREMHNSYSATGGFLRSSITVLNYDCYKQQPKEEYIK